MRIELQFVLKNCKLPFDYRRVFLAFFKKALTEIADGRFYREYYSVWNTMEENLPLR